MKGYLIDDTVYGVELKYAGQSVPITTTNLTITNARQKAKIDLSKKMEEDLLFNIGMHLEILNVKFGLYAAEDIVAADGTKIPKNGLMEIVQVNKDGKAQFTTDIPFGKYYIQEYATDEHYILSDTKYPIEFQYGGPEIAIIEITANSIKILTASWEL